MNEKKSLLAALLAAQAGIPTVVKDATNPHFKTKYATLDGIWAAVRATLAKAGLVVTNSIADGVVTTTIAEVKSGESISSSFPVPANVTAQGIGSALTYARRYNLCALLQITTGDDDDGNAASGTTAPAPKAKPSETAPRVTQIDFTRSPFKDRKPWAEMATDKLEAAMAYKHALMTDKHREAIAAELAKRTQAKLANLPEI